VERTGGERELTERGRERGQGIKCHSRRERVWVDIKWGEKEAFGIFCGGNYGQTWGKITL
jgi:hypothetical protein